MVRGDTLHVFIILIELHCYFYIYNHSPERVTLENSCEHAQNIGSDDIFWTTGKQTESIMTLQSSGFLNRVKCKQLAIMDAHIPTTSVVL